MCNITTTTYTNCLCHTNAPIEHCPNRPRAGVYKFCPEYEHKYVRTEGDCKGCGGWGVCPSKELLEGVERAGRVEESQGWVEWAREKLLKGEGSSGGFKSGRPPPKKG